MTAGGGAAAAADRAQHGTVRWSMPAPPESPLDTDHAIFSPAAPFFRVADAGSLLPHPFFVAGITAPAPHSEWLLRDRPGATRELVTTFRAG